MRSRRLAPIGTLAILASAFAALPPLPARADVAAQAFFDTPWSPLDLGGGDIPASITTCPSGTYTVPAGVTQVVIDAIGGHGAPGSPSSPDPTGKVPFVPKTGGGYGGRGARVTATLDVTPGQVLNVVVATDAGSPQAADNMNWSPAGGWGGGGVAANGDDPVSGGGGGASYVTTATLEDDVAAGIGNRAIDNATSTGCKPADIWNQVYRPPYNGFAQDTSQMLLVAGGGGGGGNASAFGNGGNGGDAGMPGGNGQAGAGGTGSQSGGGGGGGGQTSGGPTGSIGLCSQLRWDGTFLQGGFAGVDSFTQEGSAGGGSGLFGGGSGGRSCNSTGAGGGGGGSSYIRPGASNTSSSLDETLHPYVSITPVLVNTSTSLQLSASQVGTGHSVTFTAAVSPAPSGGVVDFTANNGSSTTDLGTASVDTSTGQATMSPTLAAGQWQVTAAYQGHTPYVASTSGSQHLQVGTIPAVTLDPVNRTATAAGTSGTLPVFNSVTFTAAGTGDPAPSVQWQRQISGTSNWFNIQGANSTSYTYTPTELQENGDQFRAEFSNPAGKVDSAPAALTLLSGPQALLFPPVTRVFDGNPVQLQGLAIANPLATGTWEMSTNGGGTWGPVTSAFQVGQEAYVPSNDKTDDWLNFSATLAMNGYQFRIRYTNQVDTGTAAGTVTETAYTSPVLLLVMSANITFGFPPQHCAQVPDRTQPLSPTNHYDCSGADLHGLYLEGLPAAYGVFKGTNFTGADLEHTAFPWSDVSNANFSGADIQYGGFGGFGGVPATNAAIMTGANLSGANLKYDMMNYADLTGVNITGADFTNASVIGTTFTHTAAMPPDLIIYSATPVGAYDATGGMSDGPSPVTGLFLGNCFGSSQWSTAANPNPITCQVFVPGVIGQGSGEMYVTVLPPAPAVTTNPADATVNYGNPAPHSAQFTAAANGAAPLSVQWQVSTDHGATFTDVPNATDTTLTLSDPPVADDGWKYHAVFSNSDGDDTTTAATLHVIPAPPTPVFVVVSGQQPFGSSSPSFAMFLDAPPGVTVSGTPTCTGVFTSNSVHKTINAALPAGEYFIDGLSCGGVTVDTPGNYDLEYVSDGPLAFTVVPVVIHVSVSGTMTSGADPPPAFTETDDAPAGITVPASIQCSKLGDGSLIGPDTPVGTYTLDGTSCSDGIPLSDPVDYALVFQGEPNGFTVTPPAIRVHVFAVQTYGGTPDFMYAPEFVPGVTVSGTLSCTGALPATKPVGPYPLGGTCSGLSASDPGYVVTYVYDVYNVVPAELHLTADSTSINHGQSLPAFTYHLDGLVNSETPSVVTGVSCSAPSAGTTPPVGTYDIVCSGGTAKNYVITQYTSGTLTVLSTDATVVADNQVMTYGGTVPAFTYHVDGLNPTDSAAVVSGVTCTSTAGSPPAVGGYTITCSGGSATNYTLHYQTGTLQVGRAHLTVTADDKLMPYGGTVPALTATVSGFVNSDGAGVVGGAANCATTVGATSAAGPYPGAITCTVGTLSAANYDFPAGNFVAGEMIVTRAHLTVTADARSMAYGGTVPTLTATISGFVNSQTLAGSGVTGMPSCLTTATPTSPVTTYPITCTVGTLSAANYDFPAGNFVAGTLTVNPAHLTVTADNQAKYYGDAVPPLTATISGFANNQTLAGSGVTGSATCSTTATPSSPASTTPYPITCTVGSLSAANYDFPAGNFVPGGLTVNREPVTVTAKPKSMTYGGPVPPAYDATVSGLVSPDSFTSLGGSCGSATASTTLAAGTYPGAITCTGITSTNYSVDYYPGTLTVNQAVLTVTADDKSMTYGATALPAFTATITGYLNGDPGSVVSGSPSCGTTATIASPAGQYPITCNVGAMSAHDYSFTPAGGTLTIGKHQATVGYTGGLFVATPTTSSTTANVTLQALVVPAAGGTVDLTKAQVRFLLYRSTDLSMASPLACNAPSVTAAGVAVCTYNGLATDNWTVVPVIPSTNGYFTAPSGDPVVLTVYQQTSDAFGTGGGWVTDSSQTVSPANRHGNFGFNVHTTSSGPKGQSVFTFRGADGYDYVVKSNSWQGGGDAIGTRTASFSGKCNVAVIDPTTGLQVAGLGGGNYTYRVDATQGTAATKTAPATPSTYAISVYTPQGVLWHQAGTTAVQLPLGGGNIVVHPR